jgi:hypothetical protein
MTTALMNKIIQHISVLVQYPVCDSPYPQAYGYGGSTLAQLGLRLGIVVEAKLVGMGSHAHRVDFSV